MDWPIIIIIVSIALLLLYLHAYCERILRWHFGDEFLHSVVNANELVGYERLRMQLKCDFLALTYLLKTKRRFSIDERLLRMYFRVVFLLLWFKHRMGLSERAAVLKLTSILEYFANVLGVTPMKVDQHEPRLRTYARWCLASFVGMVCILYSAVLGAFFPRITTFPAFPVLLVLVCLLFLIVGGSR